jgi:hypothetical protein
MSDVAWGAVCDSLKAHPTLEVLNLLTTGGMALAPAVLKSRIQALVNMMKVITTIHTIQVDACYSQHELFRESVIPYLETNRFRPRVRATQKTRPIPYRAKVLGRALLAVRTNANSFWMLLSGNAEVAFPSRATTILAAATAAFTSAANVATVAASVMSASTTTGTGSVPSTAAAAATDAAASAATPFTLDSFAPTGAGAGAGAANAATSSAGQKRRARP